MFDRGHGVPEDAVAAYSMHRRACTLGDLEGCVAVVECLRLGARLTPIVGRLEVRRKAMQRLGLGDLRLDFGTSTCTADEPDLPTYLARTIGLLRQRCDEGHAGSCASAAYLLVDPLGQSTPESDRDGLQAELRARELTLLRGACSSGSARDCDALAKNLWVQQRTATTVGSNMASAAEVDAARRRACELDAKFCMEEALDLEEAGDARRARDQFEAACEADRARACFHLGRMRASARGGPLDLEGAAESHDRACFGPGDLRDGEACLAGGELRAQRKGATDTGVLVRRKRACTLGIQRACPPQE